MNVFTDITKLIALVKAGSYWSAFLMLTKIIAEIGALFPTPAPTPVIPTEVGKHLKAKATKATTPVALCAEIEQEVVTSQAVGAPSGALLALLLKLAPLLLALLGL